MREVESSSACMAGSKREDYWRADGLGLNRGAAIY